MPLRAVGKMGYACTPNQTCLGVALCEPEVKAIVVRIGVRSATVEIHRVGTAIANIQCSQIARIMQ